MLTPTDLYDFVHNHRHYSVRRRGKNYDASRREGVGVVVEKNEESRRTVNKNSCNLLTAITHTEILCALYKTNKQFNKKIKL